MSKYTVPQIEKMLDSMQIIVDSREQDTERLRRRIQGFNRPCVRACLNYGDYSAIYTDIDDTPKFIDKIAAIERKQNLTEICTNFTTGRERFKREFERATADGCHMHIIIEDDNYEKLFAQKYRSKLCPQSLIASLLSWSIRYGFKVHYCKSETTGRLIAEILHYELRNYLINLEW